MQLNEITRDLGRTVGKDCKQKARFTEYTTDVSFEVTFSGAILKDELLKVGFVLFGGLPKESRGIYI
jgi:hypothetical protein